MPELTPRLWEVFFNVFEALPRQGPGNSASTARAFALCRDLPPSPAVLDLGCGKGGQTLHLAALSSGPIEALDQHAPFIAQLTRTADERGLAHRLHATVGDMSQPPFAPASFDLLWSEGALYNIGIERGLRLWRPLLKTRGYLAFTEAVWRRANPPEEIRSFWEQAYPQIADNAAILALIARAGYEVCGHFTLPDEAWWDDYYTPMVNRVALLRPNYHTDREATATLDHLLREVDFFRRYSAYYGYEFFVAQRSD